MLVNTATATTCDCGWSFERGAMTEARRYRPGGSPVDRRRAWALHGIVFVVGVAAMVLGFLVAAAQRETGIIVSGVGILAMLIAAISAAFKVLSS
jgi:cytochrome b561